MKKPSFPGNSAHWLAFAWGFAEATLFFIVPDVYLSRLALTDRRLALRACISCAVGATAGGALIYGLARIDAPAVYHVLNQVPAISPALVSSALGLLRDEGWAGMLHGAFIGIPYKLFAYLAGAEYRNALAFILASLLARLPRFLLAVVIGHALSHTLLKAYDLRTRQTILLGLWGVFYLWYFYTMRP